MYYDVKQNMLCDQYMVLGKMYYLKQDVVYEAKRAVKQNVLFKIKCIL